MNSTDNTNETGSKRAVPARPAAKADPRRAKRRASSDELSRQRVRRPQNSGAAASQPKKTVTAVSEVRKNAYPVVLKRSEAKVSRPADKRVKPPAPQAPVLSKKSIEQKREKKIMSGILAALNENEASTPANTTQSPPRENTPAKRPARTVTNAPERKSAPASPSGPVRKARLSEEQAHENERDEKNEKEAIETVRRNTAIANTVVCSVVLFGIGLALIVGPRKSGFINSENRLLAEKPEMSVENLTDGSYFTDLSKWYTDTVSVREDLKPFSNNFSKLFGITMDDVKITGNVSPVKKETLETSANTTTTAVTLNTDFKTTTSAPSADMTTTSATKKKKKKTEKVEKVEADVNGEWMGSVVVSGKGKDVRAMSGFYGTFDMGSLYADAVNKYKEELGNSVNVFTLNMPSAVAYYLPKNLEDQFTSQSDCIKNIGNSLQNVINVDVYDALAAHKDEYIYSRTDHHWQPLGAYYAAKVFADKAQFDCPDLSTYETFKIEDFVGTMYAYSDYNEELNKNPDTFIYHKPDNNDSLDVTYYDSSFSNPQYGGSLFFDYASGVSCYSAILGNDDEIAEIKTDVHNGRTLVIIKDSYGNALTPYLTHGFEKIYVCDFRFFNINAIDFIEQVGATDLLFAVSLQAAHTESNITIINNDRVQGYSAPASEPAAEPAVVIPENTENNYDNGGYNDYNNEYYDYNYDQNEGW